MMNLWRESVKNAGGERVWRGRVNSAQRGNRWIVSPESWRVGKLDLCSFFRARNEAKRLRRPGERDPERSGKA